MIYESSLSFVEKLDQSDPLRSYRKKFHYPVDKELNVWEKDGVLGQHGRWEKFHERLIHPSARLVGAKPSEVVVMNALTVNIHLLLISFYQPTKTRNKIMIEKGAFPSDQYAVESQIKLHGFNPKECLVELTPRNGEKNTSN